MVGCIVPIVVCGKNKDIEIYNLINNTLKKDFFLSHMEDNSCIKPDKLHSNSLNFYYCDEIPQFICNSGILIFTSSFKLKSSLMNIPHGTTCILDSSNAEAIKALSGKNLQIITCGMSNKDTISVASLDFPRVAVSLQRSIICLDGKTIEPKENIIIINKEYDVFFILASYAISLILGLQD